MNRRFQFSLVVFAGALCVTAVALLLAVGPDALLAMSVGARRLFLASLRVGGIVVAVVAFAAAIFGAVVLLVRLFPLKADCSASHECHEANR